MITEPEREPRPAHRPSARSSSPAGGQLSASSIGPVSRIRRLALPVAMVGAGAVALAGVLGMLLPEQSPFAGDMPGLLGFFGPAAQAVQLGIGLAALLVVAAHRALPRRLGRAAAGLLGIVVAVSMPGSAVATAGYVLALLVLIAVPVLLVVLAFRRPAVGVPLLGLLAVVVAVGELTGSFAVSAFLGVFLGGIGGAWLTLLATTAHTIAALALLALAVVQAGRRLTDAVRRARVPVTIAAAACALPYLVARASWLTPWPLLGPSREVLDSSPATMATGLLLGSAMLVGAVLTLGLILPWGERFPRWVPRISGRPVPVALAVVPALLVAVLFTVGGIGITGLGAAATEVGAPGFRALELALVLPFWLWGPLLALAAWGYALHRAQPRPAPVVTPA